MPGARDTPGLQGADSPTCRRSSPSPSRSLRALLPCLFEVDSFIKQKAKCQGFQGSPTCPGELPSTHLHEMVPKHLCHHPIISQASVGIRAESAPYRWPSVGKDPCGEVTGPAAGGLSADSLGGNPPEGSLPVSGSPRTPPASHRPEAPVHRHPPVDGKVKRWGPFILPPLGVWNEDTQGVASVPSLRRMVFTPSQSASHPPTLWESRLVASTLRLPPGPRGDKASQGFRPQQLLLTCRPACLEPTCPALGHPHRPSNSWLGRQTSHLFSPLPLPPTSGLLYTSNLLPRTPSSWKRGVSSTLTSRQALEAQGAEEGKGSGRDFHF